MSVKYSLSAPTLGSMDMQLSFKMTSMLVSSTPPWFNPSKAKPAVMAPSPITATCCVLRSPLWRLPTAMPSAARMPVLLWPTPKVS